MSTIKCTKCNNSIPQESAFCSFCGAKIEPQDTKKTCFNCSQNIPLDSEFCPFCGNNAKNHLKESPAQIKYSNQKDSSNAIKNQTSLYFTNLPTNNIVNNIKKLKHISITEGEKALLIGSIGRKTWSLMCWIIAITFWIVSLVLIISNAMEITYFYYVELHHIQPYNINILSISNYYFALAYGSSRIPKSPDYLLLFIIYVILFIIPIIVFTIIRSSIKKSELLLSDKNIYLYIPNGTNLQKIPLTCIKSIKCSECLWFWGAGRIKITTNNEEHYIISGVNNAQDFVNACIQAVNNTIY